MMRKHVISTFTIRISTFRKSRNGWTSEVSKIDAAKVQAIEGELKKYFPFCPKNDVTDISFTWHIF